MEYNERKTQEAIENELELYQGIKDSLWKLDYSDIRIQSSFRKLRHHLDQMILHLGKLTK